MAAFKGGPALPKRTRANDSESEYSDSAYSNPAHSAKKAFHRTTNVLANSADDSDGPPTSDTVMEEEDELRHDGADTKPHTVVEGGELYIPLSDIRSTSNLGEEGQDNDENEASGSNTSRPIKPVKKKANLASLANVGKIIKADPDKHAFKAKGEFDMDETDDDDQVQKKKKKPAPPATPKKAKASPSKTAVMKTPTKMEAASSGSAAAPKTPEQAPLASVGALLLLPASIRIPYWTRMTTLTVSASDPSFTDLVSRTLERSQLCNAQGLARPCKFRFRLGLCVPAMYAETLH